MCPLCLATSAGRPAGSAQRSVRPLADLACARSLRLLVRGAGDSSRSSILSFDGTLSISQPSHSEVGVNLEYPLFANTGNSTSERLRLRSLLRKSSPTHLNLSKGHIYKTDLQLELWFLGAKPIDVDRVGVVQPGASK